MTTDTTTDQTADQVDESADTGDTTDWKAEAEKYQAIARKQEERAKANAVAAKELDKIRSESATDMEKAVSAASDAARTEAFKTMGARLVDAEVRAAVSGRNIDVKALLEGLDRSRFLDEDGEPLVEAITKWVDRIAPPTDAQGRPARVPAGVRDPGKPVADDASVFANFRNSQLSTG